MTNSNLDLSALILHKANLLEACPEVNMATPCSGSDKTPTVSCSTWEASTTNQVVVDLLHICALHSGHFFLNLSVVYHLVQDNCM